MNLFTKLVRPKKATGSTPGMLHPKTWNELIDYVEQLEEAVRRLQIESTSDILATIQSGGTTLRLAKHSGSGAPPATGPFCRRYRVTVDDITTLYLMGGSVSGGTGNITIDDIELAILGEEPVDGTYLWIEASFTAYTEDDVLLPGGDVTAATTDSGTELPENVIPTFDEPAGSVIVVLGQWSNGQFFPSACGNIFISHCLGSLTYSRV